MFRCDLDATRWLFQSRNRGSFGFKPKLERLFTAGIHSGFNLVIEVLLSSRIDWPGYTFTDIYKFQSRNRGAFRFKPHYGGTAVHDIEFQSRNRGAFRFKADLLVAEVINMSFQSRNRGSFEFKPFGNEQVSGFAAFQSRNRGSFEFKDVFELANNSDIDGFQSRNRGSFRFFANRWLLIFHVHRVWASLQTAQ